MPRFIEHGKKRVKGRDWWDIIWFIRQDTSINLKHLADCMYRRDQLDKNIELDIVAAKNDVRPFIKDKTLLDEWSEDIFMYWIRKIQIAT